MFDWERVFLVKPDGTELALLATNENGKLVTMIKDGGTNIFIKNVFHLGPAWTPKDLFMIPDAAASGNGVDEAVGMATNDFGQIIAMVKDSATNTFLYNAFFLNRDWTAVGIADIPDIAGGGQREFMLLGQNNCTGESLVQIKDSATNVFIRNVKILTTDHFPLALEAVTVNGQPAAAALGYDPNAVTFLVQVKNATNGAFIRNLNFFQ